MTQGVGENDARTVMETGMVKMMTLRSILGVTEQGGRLTSHWLTLCIGILGILASFALLFSSAGTNDIQTWHGFAVEIRTSGLFQLYTTNAMFNHPPLMGVLAWQLLEISDLLNLPFPIVFKLIPVLANVASAILLGIMWSRKAGLRRGVLAFTLFNWALCSVLVAAYHGNTDSLSAFFCLLSLYYLDLKKPGLAGLVIAAAVNVKIIPLLLIFPILAGIRTKHSIQRFCLGASVGGIPFIVAFVGAGPVLVSNILGYGSSLQPWGIQWLLSNLALFPGLPPHLPEALIIAYIPIGKIAIIASVLLLSIFGYRQGWKPAKLMACAFTLFLLLAPGFGVQYVAYLTPLIFAVSLGWGFLYALVSGVFIGFVYIHYLISIYPLQSFHTAPFPPTAAILGFIVWCLIFSFLRDCLLSGKRDLSTSWTRQ